MPAGPDAATGPPKRRSPGRARIGTAAWLGVAMLVGAALGIGGVVGIGLFRDRSEEPPASLTAATARAGQCVDIAEQNSQIDIVETPCELPHDAQIVLTAEFGDAYAEGSDIGDAEGTCRGLMDAAMVDRVDAHDGALEWRLLIDDPRNVDSFDRLVCYVRDPEARLVGSLLG